MVKNMKKILSYLLSVSLLLACFTSLGVKPVFANSMTNSRDYVMGTEENGHISGESSDTVHYRIQLTSSGLLKLRGKSETKSLYIKLYDENGEEVFSEYRSKNSNTDFLDLEADIFMNTGTYYFALATSGWKGNYNFTINFESINESFPETVYGSNNSIESASFIEPNGNRYIGQFTNADRKDIYGFELTESGRININATFYSLKYINFTLYDENGTKLFYEQYYRKDSMANLELNLAFDLTSGKYYILLESPGYTWGRRYDVALSFSSAREFAKETNGGSNNTIERATPISFNTAYNGQLALNDDKDMYAFELSSPGTVKFEFSGNLYKAIICLYDEHGTGINDKAYLDWNENTKKIQYNFSHAFNAGKYFLSIEDNGYTGNYNIKANLANANTNTKEKDTDKDTSDNSSKPKQQEKQRQEILLYSKKTINIKHKSLKEKRQIRYIDAAAMTKLKYKVISGSKFITVSKSGKVSIKRKAKKGKYKIKITAVGNSIYKKATKTVYVVIKQSLDVA